VRRVTRDLILGILAVLVVLLALGAVPGSLKSGDPYYLTATPVDAAENANGTGATALQDAAVDAATLSERSYPYTTVALANATADDPGRSGPYWRGPVGFKEAFTHSPFDEVNALRERHPNATVDEGVSVSEANEGSSRVQGSNGVHVRRNGTLYRLAVTR
jgi:hypothetical protein